MKGLVVFSFALRDEALEPNPCNMKLGDEVAAITRQDNDEIIIVAQWEVARQLRALDVSPDLIVELREDSSYLDSKGVWEDAKQLFEQRGITEVIPVAQPFLQLGVVKQMIKDDGFTIIDRKIGSIGFDNDPRNTQPWTRSRFALLMYAIRLKLGGLHGHRGHQQSTS